MYDYQSCFLQIRQLKNEVTKQNKVAANREEQTQDIQAQLETAKEDQIRVEEDMQELQKQLEEREKVMKEQTEKVGGNYNDKIITKKKVK